MTDSDTRQDSLDNPDSERPQIWDRDAALASIGGNADLARALLAELCASLPAEIARMRQTLDDGGLAATAEIAHQVSGGAAYCGVVALSNRLKALEQAARCGEGDDAKHALEAVALEAERLLALESGLG